MAIMADEHDPIAGGNAEHRDEANQRAERKDSPLKNRAGDSAHEREGNSKQHERGELPRAEIELQQQEDPDERHASQSEEPALRCGAGRKFAQKLGMISAIEGDFF